MSQLQVNLRSAAREAFRLYPEIYKRDQPTDESQIETLADAYGREDGFYDAGMTPEECAAAVKAEWAQWVEDCKNED